MNAIEQVRTAYADQVPDWVEALANQVDLSSRGVVAKQLSYSTAVVSTVLSNTYAASTDKVEERVRGLFMKEVVVCPVLGETPKHICADWRKKAKSYSSHNPTRVTMFRACTRCPLTKGGRADEKC